MTNNKVSNEASGASLALVAYSVISAVFFAACAYAQSNDPDPALWVAGYLLAGCVMNALVFHKQHPVAAVTVRVICLTNAVIVGLFVRHLISLLDFSILLSSPPQFVWSILELEEGREVVGLLLLLGHGMFLQNQTNDYSSDRIAKTPSAFAKYGGPLLAFGFVAAASYLWVYYQPAMNAKYQVEHCSGQFHESKAKDGGLDEL